jgi:hypothetical protein
MLFKQLQLPKKTKAKRPDFFTSILGFPIQPNAGGGLLLDFGFGFGFGFGFWFCFFLFF